MQAGFPNIWFNIDGCEFTFHLTLLWICIRIKRTQCKQTGLKILYMESINLQSKLGKLLKARELDSKSKSLTEWEGGSVWGTVGN